MMAQPSSSPRAGVEHDRVRRQVAAGFERRHPGRGALSESTADLDARAVDTQILHDRFGLVGDVTPGW